MESILSWHGKAMAAALVVFLAGAATTQPAGPVIGGVVKDGSGQPIGDVLVSFKWHDAAGKYTYDSTRTDSQGKWSVDRVPASVLSDWTTFDLGFMLSHPDYTTDLGGYSVRASDADLLSQTAVFTMQKCVDVRGFVMDGDGKPVAGATVSRDEFDSVPGAVSMVVITGTDGHFVFHHQSPKKAVTFKATASGYGPGMAHVEPGDMVKPVRLVLTAARDIHGRVVDSAGQPLAGANVTANWQGVQTLNISATADADGSFSLTSAPAAKVWVSAYLEGYKYTGVNCEAGQDNVTITLPAIPVVHGSVTDAKTHKPVAAFKVILGERSLPNQSAVFETEQARKVTGGQYEQRLKGLSDNSEAYFLRIEAAGYLPAESGPLHESGEQDFALEPSPDLQGTVFGADGKPAGGVTVVLSRMQVPVWITNGEVISSSRGPRCTTDGEGRYDLPPQIGKFKLAAVGPQGLAILDQDAIAEAPDIHLTAWGRVEGRLLLNGQPVEHQYVGLSPHVLKFVPNEPTVNFTYRTWTDADGGFSFDRVPPGTGTVGREVISTGVQNMTSYLDLGRSIRVVAKKMVTVELGGGGRPVTGRIVLPSDVQQRRMLHFQVMLHNVPAMPAPPTTMPDSVRNGPPQDQVLWWQQFMKTDAGRAFMRSHRSLLGSVQSRPVAVRADGSFTIDNVAAGNYSLTVMVSQPSTGKPPTSTDTLITVPPIPGGSSTEPLKVPDIVLNPQ
jgi:protocatechuate 3,4-dioxygenase beta subunit